MDCFFYLLSDQGSNLDSTDPESVVLPVTPSDKVGVGLSVSVRVRVSMSMGKGVKISGGAKVISLF